MKGIILAGGTGSRLHPITLGTSKQLIPIYNKPLIYYSLSVLMLAGIRDIFLISKPEDKTRFFNVLGNGEKFGLNITYGIQYKPEGIAQSFLIAEDFIKKDNVALILGDNIFWGHNFRRLLNKAIINLDGASIFGYPVKNPSQFGVVELGLNNEVISIEEKPSRPKSNIAVTGLYFYNNDVIEIAKNLTPSSRGELEISDINHIYLKKNKLNLNFLGRGYAWMDAGTFEGIMDASLFVNTFEKRQGNMIACLEEIALKNNWIDKQKIHEGSSVYKNSEYGQYIRSLIE